VVSFAGAFLTGVGSGFDGIYRQFHIQLLAGKMRPNAFEHLNSFGTEKIEGIIQMVSKGNGHALHLSILIH
jgi:hypothetical protein